MPVYQVTGERAFLSGNGVDLIEDSGIPGAAYPDTAVYNAVRVGNVVFHDLTNTDSAVIDVIKMRSVVPLDTAFAEQIRTRETIDISL